MRARAVTFAAGFINPTGNSSLNYPLDTWASGTDHDRYSIAFMVSESITLAKVAFYIHSVTGTPVQYDITIETDDGSGEPDGTPIATATLASGAAAGWTSELSVTGGDALDPGTIYHMVINPNSD